MFTQIETKEENKDQENFGHLEMQFNSNKNVQEQRIVQKKERPISVDLFFDELKDLGVKPASIDL